MAAAELSLGIADRITDRIRKGLDKAADEVSNKAKGSKSGRTKSTRDDNKSRDHRGNNNNHGGREKFNKDNRNANTSRPGREMNGGGGRDNQNRNRYNDQPRRGVNGGGRDNQNRNRYNDQPRREVNGGGRDNQNRNHYNDQSRREVNDGGQNNENRNHYNERPQGKWNGDGRNKPDHGRPDRFSDPRRDQDNRVRVPSTASSTEDTIGKDQTNKSSFLKEIENLSGEEDDLELIGAIESSDEDELITGKDTNQKNINAGELEDFMSEIGLAKTKSKKEEKKANVKQEVVRKVDKQSIKPEKDVKTEPKTKGPKTKEPKAKEPKTNATKEQNTHEAEKSKPVVKQLDISSLSRQSKDKSDKGSSNHPNLTVEPRTDWYNIESPSIPARDENLSSETVEMLRSKALRLLEEDNEVYNKEVVRSASQKVFLSQILTSGTLDDKISALTLIIQESPLHSMKAFESLFAITQKKSRNNTIQGITAFKDLFTSTVLPDRRLRLFTDQPLSLKADNKLLVTWAFEDWLKKFYLKLLQLIERCTHDPVEFVRLNVLGQICTLLTFKPEQEVNLLRLACNKLGDLDRKVASKTSYLLLQLEQAHPAMKTIIVKAISEIVFRPGTGYHAQYYGMITLNQTIISHRDVELANTLVKTYFNLFEWLAKHGPLKQLEEEGNDDKEKKAVGRIKKKGRWKNRGKESKKAAATELKDDAYSKLVTAILTGLNRAYPYSQLDDDVFDAHLDQLYFIARTMNFGTSVQALMLIHRVSGEKQTLSDRFYRVLYETLFDPRLVTSSKQGLYLNLLFKALKEDGDVNRVKAFVKRTVQVSSEMLHIGVFAGLIYLLSELDLVHPGLKSLINEGDAADEEEHFDDVPDEDDDDNTKEKNKELTTTLSAVSYDWRKRDPKYANAQNTGLWELLPLVNHYHPTAALYADYLYRQMIRDDINILQQRPTKPDLALHSLAHFLERFVFKTPRTRQGMRGSSIMQPLAGESSGNLLVGTRSARMGDKSVTEQDWQSMNLNQIGAEDEIFYQYFTTKRNRAHGKGKTNKQDEEDFDHVDIDAPGADDLASDIESDLDEDEVWKALVKSHPDVEGDDEDVEEGEQDESDLDIDDFSSLDGFSSDEEEEEEEDESDASGVEEMSSEDESDDGMPSLKGKRKPDNEEEDMKASRKKRKAQLKLLPTFASADDYLSD